MSIIGNPIMAGASGHAASIFVTGLSDTDTVTATKGSKTLAGKWTQKQNPAAHGLPDGYTELEYIESTGTQYIDTGISCTSGFRVKASVMATTDNYGCIVGAQNYSGSTWYRNQVSRSDSKNAGLGTGAWNVSETGSFPTNQILDIDASTIVNNVWYKIDGSSVFSSYNNTPTSNRSSETLYVLALHSNRNGSVAAEDILSCKMYRMSVYTSVDDSSIIIDFIPAKRNSDSEIGLYDLVNDVFYTNSGTGTFIGGSEVPQTIDGHMLSPIREFGTWTVTATDGEQTATQDVLVDVITEYEIEMSLTA